jgi:MFS family permease
VSAAARHGWRDVAANLRQRKVLAMLLLGFSSGIPIYLVGNTLGYWMRENGIELATIGFLSWVGLAYSLKFLWAPLVDRVDAPVLGRLLGRRRGWMLLSQLVVAAALVGMVLVEPREDTPPPCLACRWTGCWCSARWRWRWRWPRPPRTSWSMPGASRSPPATNSRGC